MLRSDVNDLKNQSSEEETPEREILALRRRKSLYPQTLEQMKNIWPFAKPMPAGPEDTRKASVAVVVNFSLKTSGYEFVSRYTAELVSRLVRNGAKPVLLDLANEQRNDNTRIAVESLWPQGSIVYEQVEEPDVPPSYGPLARTASMAYRLYEWLKKRDFDAVHGPDNLGVLSLCLRARQQGIAFAKTRFVVHPADALLQKCLDEYQNLNNVLSLPRIYMESSSLEMADTVPVTGRYGLRRLLEAGINLRPGQVEHCPIPHDSKAAREQFQGVQSGEFRRVLCLPGVSRRGTALFCKALNRGFPGTSASFAVEFAVPDDYQKDLASYAKALLSGRSEQTVVRSVPDRRSLVRLLSENPDTLCVFPVIDEWNIYQLMDLAAAGLPLVAADQHKARDLLDEETAKHSTCAPLPDAIARHIREVLKGRACYARVQSEGDLPASWISPGEPKTSTEEQGEPPLVTVCLMHFERPHLLEQALASVENQVYTNLEVVLVDDGSLKKESIQKLEELKARFQEKGWNIIRQQNRFLGAARNTAAMEARGRYLYFLDDDNILKPHALETMIRVAEHMPADIVTALSDAFEGDTPPASDATASRRIIQIGDDLSYGIFRNSFGDSNALVRRSVFLELGGNTEDYAVGKDDQEFFARAVLSGCRLTIVPEALYWARQMSARLRTLHFNPRAGHVRVCRAYLPHVPPKLRPLLLLSTGLMEESFEGRDITLRGFILHKIKRFARTRFGAWLRFGILGPFLRWRRELRMKNIR
ncbi:glycosyl transferase family 2 [Desulfonatronospira thiodismutans ASO3-1]|uniref:Glycosyl transferase family 2 n=1 Tax=Desulfonatronospira thiodismutans ASO3-1 TaxID=555779 RepID=D6SNA1_9BACT|nr:glycosyltransferase [Desulfonatronospira thiodismutans]EFI34227.1 glycosyl transferase family 2 [Desulfonatronospira thiodismutans ASO3-1]